MWTVILSPGYQPTLIRQKDAAFILKTKILCPEESVDYLSLINIFLMFLFTPCEWAVEMTTY